MLFPALYSLPLSQSLALALDQPPFTAGWERHQARGLTGLAAIYASPLIKRVMLSRDFFFP